MEPLREELAGYHPSEDSSAWIVRARVQMHVVRVCEYRVSVV
jgi:hypothetical protein